MLPGRVAPGPQGTWACSGRDCARASPRTWSSSCRAAGSRQWWTWFVQTWRRSPRNVACLTSLDKLLDAGLYTGEVTEIVGAPGSGKTQVCLCVAAHVAHGLQQNVLYIDSNGGLTASRILQLLQARTPDEEEQAGALQRIQVVRAFDIFQMLDVLQDLRGAVSQQVSSSSGTLKVVVVDSVAAVVAPLLGGQQREGLALMMQLARELKTLARDLSVAVLVTNHMTRDRDSGQLKPALGRSWSFVPSTRLLLDSTQSSGSLGSWRVVCLTKSPRLPTGCQETVDLGSLGTPAFQGDHKGH
uniref:DNA repair protein RAD51 homolog 4 n=1 Tax=Bos taurus TaxID=9913 RepID=A0AAA9TK39_BOVIN